jgi:hypothetical protein
MRETDIVEWLMVRLGDVENASHLRSRIDGMLKRHEGEWRNVIEADGFDVSLLQPLLDLPSAFQTPAIAAVMGQRELMERFVDLIARLRVEDFPEQRRLLRELETAAPSWDAVTQALREIYLRLPLPPQVIPDDDQIRYLPDGLSLVEADRVYQTTFHRDLPVMMRSRRQCYEWRGDPGALVMLASYRKRWIILSVAGAGIDEDHPVRTTIANHLRPHGIGLGPELPDLLELFLKLEDFDFKGLPIRFD